MRVIDADEAKEKMKDMAAYSTHGCLLYLSDVLHKIDECQTLNISGKETGWIPVSKRLPEKGIQILVYAQSAHHVIAKYDSMLTEDGYRDMFVTYDAYHGMQEINNVIEWMPLPEPYNGDQT